MKLRHAVLASAALCLPLVAVSGCCFGGHTVEPKLAREVGENKHADAHQEGRSKPDATGHSFDPSPALIEEPDEPGLAEHPYTTAQIREAMPVGYTRKYRITKQASAKGSEAVTFQTWEVLAADDRGCTIRFTNFDESGAKLGKAQEGTSSWADLRRHADFAFKNTTREDVRFLVHAGTFECWRYTITKPASEGSPSSTTVCYFPRGLAGGPIHRVMETGESRLAMTLLEQKRP
jgi:hypothetical protein